VSAPLESAEHRLRGLLAADDPNAAHGRYNALVRSSSASSGLSRRELADADRVRAFGPRGRELTQKRHEVVTQP
jgi:hypothetical protein